MSVSKHMPLVGSSPTPGRVVKIHRLPGHYVGDHEPVLDVLVADNVLTILAPEAGKILTSRELGDVVNPGDLVLEVTGVGTPTYELFVAYRRADAPGHAGRLGERLIKDFGAGQVFKDIESLPPGVDFVQMVRVMLQRAAAMVVVIGPQWLTLRNEKGPRIEAPGDLHREEIRTALERGLWLFPALVNGARMPPPEQLPEDIRALSYRQAIEVSDLRWDYDMNRLSRAVAGALSQSPRREAFLAQLKSRDEFGGTGWQLITDDPSEHKNRAR